MVESSETARLALDIAPNDPVLAFLQGATGPVDVATLPEDSPAAMKMRESGVELVVPLVASGEMVGLLALGPRLSERGYSHDDRRLLDTLARYAAPALRLGQMVRQQQAEARSPGADRARAQGRPADPAAVPAELAAKPRRLGPVGFLSARPNGRRRLLRRHGASRRSHHGRDG